MIATHERRRKHVSPVKSTSSDLTNFVELLVNASLTTTELVLKILRTSGPFTVSQLNRKCIELGKITNTASGTNYAIKTLMHRGLVVKVNDGYAIHNWDKIGA